jgi:hypothetical protein
MLYTKEKMKMQELALPGGSHDPPKLCPECCSRGPGTRRHGTVQLFVQLYVKIGVIALILPKSLDFGRALT